MDIRLLFIRLDNGLLTLQGDRFVLDVSRLNNIGKELAQAISVRNLRLVIGLGFDSKIVTAVQGFGLGVSSKVLSIDKMAFAKLHHAIASARLDLTRILGSHFSPIKEFQPSATVHFSKGKLHFDTSVIKGFLDLGWSVVVSEDVTLTSSTSGLYVISVDELLIYLARETNPDVIVFDHFEDDSTVLPQSVISGSQPEFEAYLQVTSSFNTIRAWKKALDDGEINSLSVIVNEGSSGVGKLIMDLGDSAD